MIKIFFAGNGPVEKRLMRKQAADFRTMAQALAAVPALPAEASTFNNIAQEASFLMHQAKTKGFLASVIGRCKP